MGPSQSSKNNFGEVMKRRMVAGGRWTVDSRLGHVFD